MGRPIYNSSRIYVSALIAILLTFSVISLCGCSQKLVFEYSANGDGTATITKYIGDKKQVDIQQQLDGMTVTIIGEGAFRKCSTVTSVVLEDTVEVIEDECFTECISLRTIALPGVRSIGRLAFNGCSALSEVDLMKASVIGEGAFEHCRSLESLVLSDDEVNIAAKAFRDCTALISISGGSAATIDTGAFYGCERLEQLEFGQSAIIDGGAFENCTNLRRVKFSGAKLPEYQEKWISGYPSFPEWTSVELSPEYRKANRVYVYEEGSSVNPLFGSCSAVNEGNELSAEQVASISTVCMVDPCNGLEAIDCTFSLPSPESTSGFMFMNSANPNTEGVDLSGSNTINFYAKGVKGGEKVVCFVGEDTSSDEDDEESESQTAPTYMSEKVTLTDQWKKYTLELGGIDLSNTKCGFGFTVSYADNAGGNVEIYLDEIYYEGHYED